MWEKVSKADENADGLVSEQELQGAYRRRDGNPGNPADKPADKPGEKPAEKPAGSFEKASA